MVADDNTGSTRRTVLCAAALAGTAAAVGTAGCERRDPRPNQELTGPVALGAADEVPVGGARLYREEKVLVSRPAAEDYRAFSAVCPHAGCVLSAIRDETAVCSCHGSTFDPATGAVLRGPAEEPLPALELEFDGDGAPGVPSGSMTARPPASPTANG